MSSSIQVQVKYFASLRESMGVGPTVVTQATTVGQLRAELMALDALHAEHLGPGRAVRMALNRVLCADSALLSDGAEVAFFPPVTGG